MARRIRTLIAVALGLAFLAACGAPQTPVTKYELDVLLLGDGTGSLVSSPAGINTTGGLFDAEFNEGTAVTLTATAAAGSTFEGFGFPDGAGYDCEGGSTATTCVLTMDVGKSVNATFGLEPGDPDFATLAVQINLGGDAEGKVVSEPEGIDTADGSDSFDFQVGTTVELTASASAGGFAGWTGGDCDGLKTTTCTVTINVGEPSVTANFNDVQTLTVRVAANGDDAVEFLADSSNNSTNFPEGWTWANFARLDIGRDPDHAATEAGFRFPGVTVPVGARVQSAVLQLTAHTEATNAGAGALSLLMRGQAALNPVGFPQDPQGSPSFNITGREARTTASVVWSIPAVAWTANTAYSAPDAAAVLQEIVGQAGWSSGNAVVLFLRHDTPSLEGRRVWTFDGTAVIERRPTLEIEFVALP